MKPEMLNLEQFDLLVCVKRPGFRQGTEWLANYGDDPHMQEERQQGMHELQDNFPP